MTIYREHAEHLSGIGTWSLTGKLSLDDAEQGGSGRFQWNVEPELSKLDFHGAMGRGAWHLQISADGAVLKQANGLEQWAPGVDELVREHMGWPIPVGALQWWVRGLVAPGVVEDEVLNTKGLLDSFRQFGWYVEYRRYESEAGVELPVRLHARREDYRIKLAIGRWRLGNGIGH